MERRMNHLEKRGFTLIELLVTIAVTIVSLATFFRLYTASVRTDRASSLRTSANINGEQIIDVIEKAIRLTALNNEFGEFEALSPIFTTLTGSSDGTSGATFVFYSPYGGPITKLTENASGPFPCTNLQMMASPNMTVNVPKIKFMTRNGVFIADVAWTHTNEISRAAPSTMKDLDGNNLADDCDVALPAGTLVTGMESQFTLSHSISGGVSKLEFKKGAEVIFEIDSDKSKYSIPFFVLEFLREYEDASGDVVREWHNSLADSDETKQIKAVRIGFVLVSEQELRLKTGEDTAFTIDYCPFEKDVCYEHNDRNKAAYMFRRVIHIRNFDYMERNKNVAL
jgi:prepilin-type N-terminal cleavage/methylation domain-containing protein